MKLTDVIRATQQPGLDWEYIRMWLGPTLEAERFRMLTDDEVRRFVHDKAVLCRERGGGIEDLQGVLVGE